MDVFVNDNKLRKLLQDETMCGRHYGPEMARKITARVTTLKAAESLADLWPPESGPERCHELKGDRVGTFSVDLKHPYRLLFKPHNEQKPPSDRSDEHQRWKTITAIDVISIEDTHG